MAGLLDFLGTDDAKLGMALLAAAGPSPYPASFGQRLQGAMQTLDAEKANKYKMDLLQSQAEENRAQADTRKAAMADQRLAAQTALQYFTPGKPAVGLLDSALPAQFQTGVVPQQAVAPRFDMQGFAQARMAQNPAEGMKLLAELQKEKPINKLDAKDFTPESVQKFSQSGNYADLVRQDKLHFADTGGAIAGLNPFTGAPVSTSPKSGNPFSDLVVRDAGGNLVPNAPLMGAKTSIAAAGAPKINVNTDKSYFGQVADGLAKNDVAAIEAARSAPDRIASAQRVKQILQQNPITGTGAEARLGVAKAFATAGLVDPKQANATEALVTELAAQTLDSIKTSGLGSGQGFTDKDRNFLQDARSGRIEMTPQNIARIADLNEMSARATIARGNTVINKLRSAPGAGTMGQQLDVVEAPPPLKGAPSAAAPKPQQAFDSMPTANASNKGRFLTDQVTGKRFQSNGIQWVEVK